MNVMPDRTVVCAWARLMKVQQSALAAIEDALKVANLPPLAWYDALLELERAGDRGLRPFELEREMLLAQYNLSRLIDRIEKAGYAERRACKDDGRGQVVAITASGRAMRRTMWRVYGPAIQSAFGQHLSSEEAATLAAWLHRLIDKTASK